LSWASIEAEYWPDAVWSKQTATVWTDPFR
jgi:hypothetical protein